jgi:membrane-bound lytic murein transglycosylase
MKTPFLGLIAVAAGLGAPSPILHADEAPPPAATARVLSFTHLWADTKGVSHFRDEKLSFEAATPENPAAGTTSRPNPDPEALVSLPLRGAIGATFLYLKRAAVEDWHRAPRRMFLIAVQGMSEVTASDGEVRRFGLGSILLMDDLTGKGHITRAVGTLDHIALTIPSPAAL